MTILMFFLGIAWVIASIIAALVFMPKFREMNYTSVYEVFFSDFFCLILQNNLSSI
jgi:hypothetical protein